MFRRFSFAAILAVCLVGVPLPAAAVLCTIDDVPAATLLLPYFEVDLRHPNGADTVFSVNNSDPAAVLAHVVIWSDLSVPVFDFNVYLTGYDVQVIDLRDILVSGMVPQTASAGQDPSDTISPKGVFSQDINFASCNGLLPSGPLPATFITHLQTSLTGRPSPLLGGNCAGLAYGDHIARGYVTVDTVANCTLRFPSDIGYFAPGGAGDATDQNVLWGDVVYSNPKANQSYGDTLVHIEASATNPETSFPGQYTFYGRYVGWTATDHREPLATNFAARFSNLTGAAGSGTSLVTWRDSKVAQGAFKCGTAPAWYPLGQEEVVIFDEQEHALVPLSFPVSPQPPGGGIVPFPAEAQSTVLGGASFPVPFQSGWLFLDLNTTVTPAGSVPPEDPAAAQAWVEVLMNSSGRYSVGFDAIRLDSACAAKHQLIDF
jgi:hypothetical protein